MSKIDTQQHHRVDFLYKAGHGMLFQLPSLSRYYMNEYQLTMEEYDLKQPKKTDRLQCISCGQIRLPGLNTRVELIQHKKKRNKLSTTCLACSRTTNYSGSNKKKLPITSVLPVIDDIPLKIESNKKKKNKGKKNSLKAMLNKSNTTTTTTKSGGLGDFLSSL